MPLVTRIDLPAPSRPVGGLLSAARPLPTGWERGVTFGDAWCLAPSPWPYCLPEGSEDSKTADGKAAPAEFEPLGLFQAVECTTMDTNQAQNDAAETLAATADWLLGAELQTGSVTGNPNLEDATPVASAATGYAAALATVDQQIALGLSGRLGFIHVTPLDLAMLVSEQVLVRDGRTWRSPSGHTVVSSPGYTFDETLHATPEVFASLSPLEARVDVDRAINQTVAYAEQIGLAVFPPCFNISVEVT
jgi:hypothetical protein